MYTFSPKYKVKTKNNQKEKFLGALIRAQVGNSHTRLVSVRRKIWNRGLEIACVQIRKANFANMLWKTFSILKKKIQ